MNFAETILAHKATEIWDLIIAILMSGSTEYLVRELTIFAGGKVVMVTVLEHLCFKTRLDEIFIDGFDTVSVDFEVLFEEAGCRS